MKSKVIILGAGLTGCAAARECSMKGYDVTIVEKNAFLGGGCHTFFWGGHPYTEGPRQLFVANDRIFNYINDIVPMKYFSAYYDTYIEKDRSFYSFPIHWDDIQLMPDKDKILKELSELPEVNNATNLEDGWINAVGPTLYEKYVNTYTKKMWGIKDNKEFSGLQWSLKGEAIQYGDRKVGYEKGNTLHAYPIEETGYNRFFEYCVKDAQVILNKEIKKVDLEKRAVYIEDETLYADIIISTIALDDLMNKEYGELRYRGRDFYPIILPIEHIFPNGHQYIYYPNQEEYTRIVEYKAFTGHKAKDTLIVLEIPSQNNKLYTYCNLESEKQKAQKYLDNLPRHVYSIGNIGSYQYLTMGDCFEMVWSLMERL